MMGQYFNNMGWGYGFGFGWIFMIIFWALIIWAIYALIRSFSGRSGHSHEHGEGMHQERKVFDILKERYAKGEISKEDFDRMKKDLE
jgi:putative membrane protein